MYFDIIAVLSFFLLIYYYKSIQDSAGIFFATDDPQLVAAKKRARETLPEFWAALDAGHPADTMFVLKFSLNHGVAVDEGESIWAGDIVRHKDRIFGTLWNAPKSPDFRVHQKVEIPADAIDDWGYFHNGVAQGHFVTRLMISLAPARLARQQNEEMGWHCDPESTPVDSRPNRHLQGLSQP